MSSQKDPNVNPFAELLSGAQSSNIPIQKHLIPNDEGSTENISVKNTNKKLQNIFHLTLNPDSKSFVFLPQLYVNLNNQTDLDRENINQAVFERLLLSQGELNKVSETNEEGKCLWYLCNCYERLYQEIPNFQEDNLPIEKNLGELVKDTILNNAATALQSPDLYSQDITQQFVDLLKQLFLTSRSKHLTEFLLEVLKNINENYGYPVLADVAKGILTKVYALLANITIADGTLFDALDMIQFFTQTPFLCQALLEHSTPPFLIKLDGKAYEEPLIGTTNASNNSNPNTNHNATNTNGNTVGRTNSNTNTLNAFREAFDRGLRNVYPNMANMPHANTPGSTKSYGKQFEDTLLGRALGISCIPTITRNKGASLFFNNVSQLSRQEHKSMEQNLWKPLSALVDKLYGIFYALLKASPDIRHETLKWLGYCLSCNSGRAKIWSTQLPEVFAATYASDPFMLNLSAVLLKLCKPFSYPNSDKLLKVDTNYSRDEPKSDSEAKIKNKHMIDLPKETCLLSLDPKASPGSQSIINNANSSVEPVTDSSMEIECTTNKLQRDSEKANEKSYNFVTECLFMTEKCLDLGFRVILSRFLKLNQDLGRLQNYYETAINNTPGGSSGENPALRNIKEAMEKGLSTFLSTKAALLEPHFLVNFFNLHVALCQYLCYEIYRTSKGLSTEQLDFNPDITYFTPPHLEIEPETSHDHALGGHTQKNNEDKVRMQNFLSTIPEFFLENLFDLLMLLSHFSDESLEFYGSQALEPILVMIVTLMACPERVRNPHLRAKMAEALEALVPVGAKQAGGGEDDDMGFDSVQGGYNSRNWNYNNKMNSSCRAQLFKLKAASPHFTSNSTDFATTSTITSASNANQVEQQLSHQSAICRNYLIPVLIHVFVSIEETGQNVAFEQKFSYRRPMYVVMKYLWKSSEHRKVAKMMADEAEQNIEAINPPLFLRFINLLINDAIFLLDEALSYMNQIRELQIAKDSGNWDKLTQEQRTENENNLQHLGLMARYHNVLGLETIRVIDYITRYIYTIFTHSTMVNRITSMLNYFLLHLVGPKKKNLKVKDLAVYEFKPQEIVTTICQIYVNLGSTAEVFSRNNGQQDFSIVNIDQTGNKKKSLKTLDDKEALAIMKRSEESFCRAVSQDGRSYSAGLFTQALEVLYKIGTKAAGNALSSSSFSTYTKASNLTHELEIVAQKVKDYAAEQEQEDELTGDAPDEFLDPIMNTLMINPVILPTSGKIVDRSTIARHLLSDQNDPFNRLPLTLDMVKSDAVLKQKIENWKAAKKAT